MKHYVLIKLFIGWVIIGNTQTERLFPNDDPFSSNFMVEIIENDYYLIEEPINVVNNSRVFKVDSLGNKDLIIDLSSIDGSGVFRINALWKERDSIYAITQFAESVSKFTLGLMVFDSDFQFVEVRNRKKLKGAYIHYETKDKIWNPHENRFEWIYAIRAFDPIDPILEVIRIYMDEGNLIYDIFEEQIDFGLFFHAVINQEINQYLISSGNDMILLDKEFQLVNRFPVLIKYDGVTYAKTNHILTWFSNDTIKYYLRRIGHDIQYLRLSELIGIIHQDTIVSVVEELEVLDPNTSSYLVYSSENDFDKSRFLYWAEASGQSPSTIESVHARHFNNFNTEISTISIQGIAGYISDIEYHNGIYFGCGIYNNSDKTSFYFFFDEESQYVSTTTNNPELNQTSYKIFPNPTTGIINITHLSNETYEIFSLDGKRIMNGTIYHQIDLKHIPTGNYFIRISNGKSFNSFLISKI